MTVFRYLAIVPLLAWAVWAVGLTGLGRPMDRWFDAALLPLLGLSIAIWPVLTVGFWLTVQNAGRDVDKRMIRYGWFASSLLVLFYTALWAQGSRISLVDLIFRSLFVP